MSGYSYNLDRQNVVFAKLYDVNASYKNLNAVCDAIRYLKVNDAMAVLDRVIEMDMPILYKRYNKHMGSRHELGGKKGKWPEKAAKEVRKVLVNAAANAGNRGLDSESMFVVHASSNKTHIERRYPSKGSLAWGRGMYGRSSVNHSDIEYAKIEIGIADLDDKLGRNMKYFIKKNVRAHYAGKAVEKAKKGGAKERKQAGAPVKNVVTKAEAAAIAQRSADVIKNGATEKQRQGQKTEKPGQDKAEGKNAGTE